MPVCEKCGKDVLKGYVVMGTRTFCMTCASNILYAPNVDALITRISELCVTIGKMEGVGIDSKPVREVQGKLITELTKKLPKIEVPTVEQVISWLKEHPVAGMLGIYIVAKMVGVA